MGSVRGEHGQQHGKELEYGLEGCTPFERDTNPTAVYDGRLPMRKAASEDQAKVSVKNIQERDPVCFGDLRRILMSDQPELVIVGWHPQGIMAPVAMDVLYLPQSWAPLLTEAQRKGALGLIDETYQAYRDHPDLHLHRFDDQWRGILNDFMAQWDAIVGERFAIRPTWKRGHVEYADGRMKEGQALQAGRQFRVQCFMRVPSWQEICATHASDHCRIGLRGSYLSPDDQMTLTSIMYGYARDDDFAHMRQAHEFWMGTAEPEGNRVLVKPSGRTQDIDLTPIAPTEALRRGMRVVGFRRGKSHHPRCRYVKGRDQVYSFALRKGASPGLMPGECAVCKAMAW